MYGIETEDIFSQLGSFQLLWSYLSQLDYFFLEKSKTGYIPNIKVQCRQYNSLQLLHRHIRNEKAEVVLTRLRIGHTRITHSYLFNREGQPYCFGCNTPFTVKHILLDCADFAIERRSLFQRNNLKDLFGDVSAENILSFLKKVSLFEAKYRIHLHLTF